MVVHPHLHRRRTGVTTHVEAMLRALAPSLEARGLGSALGPEIPRLGLDELLARARREPVVWHAHRNLELLVGLVLRALFPRLKVVFTRHAARLPGRWTRLLAKRADRRIALTSEMAGTLPAPSQVVPHGIDITRYGGSESRPEAWRQLGLGGRWGVGVVGRVRPDKGQLDFARAWAQARHPDWRAAVVGAARWRHRRFAEEVHRIGGQGLTLVGESAEVDRWYRGLTVVVQPSHSEGFSLVLLEALAAGCCVVAARLPHFPALVEHGQTGLLYRPGDVAELASLLEDLFANPEEAARMGACAAERARRELGLEHEAEALGRLYAELMPPP